jgi:hypothetical protein
VALEKLRQKKQKDIPEQPKSGKFSDALGPLSFALTAASWGWAVIAPDSSAIFGSVLLVLGFVFALIALFKVWSVRAVFRIVITVAMICSFVAFDWYIVIKPQKGKAFKDLLVAGYHIENGCESVPAKAPMPQWLRDQSKEWQATVGQRIADKLDAKDLQLWRDAGVLGRVQDDNVNAYQCLSLATKIRALETLISTHYDPGLKHEDYNGPIYWFDASNGTVDITDALKDSKGNAAMYFYSGTDDQKAKDKK